MFDFLRKTEPDALPLEFGPITDRDRIQISATLRLRGQGIPISSQTLPSDILESVSTSLDGNAVCRHVFRIVRSLFDGSAVKLLMKQAPVVGVMSDALSVNGLAGRLHIQEDKHLINVTAGTMLQGLVAIYRLHGSQASQLLGDEATQNATSRFYGSSFHIPRQLHVRKHGLECAIYGMLAVFCHELAHVLRGHTAFSIQKFGVDTLVEEHTSSAGAPTSVARLMEVDADDYAGQFLADILLYDHVLNKRFFDDESAQKRFLEIAVGVLALYLGFGREGGAYYGGPVRAHLLLSTLLHRCTEDRDASAWLRDQIREIQGDMVMAGLITPQEIAIAEDEKTDLVNLSIPARNAMEHEWVRLRPWKGTSETV